MNIRVRTLSHTQHYFHFLYGYIIPFVNKCSPENNKYIFDSCGPLMNQIILDLIPYKTEIYKDQKYDFDLFLESHDNPDFSGLDVKLTRKSFFSHFGDCDFHTKNEMLIIRRNEPDPFYINDAERPGSGSQRRSIPNIFDLYECVKKRRPSCKIIALEGMRLKDQIRIFRHASCVILQHGAAMANLIWCRPGTLVVEIGPEDDVWYYDKLTRMLGLRRHLFFQEHPHAEVDCQRIADFVFKKMMRL